MPKATLHYPCLRLMHYQPVPPQLRKPPVLLRNPKGVMGPKGSAALPFGTERASLPLPSAYALPSLMTVPPQLRKPPKGVVGVMGSEPAKRGGQRTKGGNAKKRVNVALAPSGVCSEPFRKRERSSNGGTDTLPALPLSVAWHASLRATLRYSP